MWSLAGEQSFLSSHSDRATRRRLGELGVRPGVPGSSLWGRHSQVWASSPQGVSTAGWGAAPLRVPVRPQLLSATRNSTWMRSRLVFEDKRASLRQVENGRYLLMTGTWICGLKAQTFILSSRRRIARPPHTPQALREDGKHIAPLRCSWVLPN